MRAKFITVMPATLCFRLAIGDPIHHYLYLPRVKSQITVASPLRCNVWSMLGESNPCRQLGRLLHKPLCQTCCVQNVEVALLLTLSPRFAVGKNHQRFVSVKFSDYSDAHTLIEYGRGRGI